MSVEIEPSELGFRRPFTVEVAQTLKIKNPNSNPVAFKVKTTAPKQYCVRPNSGRIEPDHEVEVSVLLQAMKQDPPADTKCRDKFLVQAVNITGDKEFTNVQQIWDTVEKGSVQEKKIRVVFLPAEGGSATAAAAATPVRHSLVNGAGATPETAPPAYSSPPEDNRGPSAALPSSSMETARDERSGIKPGPDTMESTVSRGSTGFAKSSGESTVDELRTKLAQAEAMIASMKEEGGLRLRKGANAVSEKVNEQAPQIAQAARQGTEGVPVKVAAVLCLISFLLAYFLF